MITIKVYKNGYEIIGHAEPKICSEVSFWHWIASNLILGIDNDAKEYVSPRDNKENPNEGYSWLTFTQHKYNLDWIMEDFIVSAEAWGKEYWNNQVIIEKTNCILEK